MSPAADLRAEAERLARQLPGLNFKAEASEAAHIGSAGRRRAGNGETFWQYRRYAQEDDAARIDWRRSAKGDDLYVRETELETARTVLFWADDHPGFRWKGEGDLRTKAEEAILLMLSMAIPMSREGERETAGTDSSLHVPAAALPAGAPAHAPARAAVARPCEAAAGLSG